MVSHSLNPLNYVFPQNEKADILLIKIILKIFTQLLSNPLYPLLASPNRDPEFCCCIFIWDFFKSDLAKQVPFVRR